MLEKKNNINIDPLDAKKFRCKKCQELVDRENYVHDDKICHGCFEKAQEL